MAVTLNSLTSTSRLAISYESTDASGQDPIWNPTFASTIKATDGTTANKANRPYVVQGTIAASGTATIDVTSLTGKLGESIALSRLCELWVLHLSTSANTSTVTVGGGSNPVFATLSVPLYAGEDVRIRKYSATGTAITTNKNILLTNNSGTLVTTYRVIIVGSQ